MKILHMISVCMLLLFSCICVAQSKKEMAIKEINEAERLFAQMAADKGIQQAFVFFAAEDAVIKRGKDSLINGKAGIGNFYAKEVFKHAALTWSPDFTDASESGDLGYTIGKYNWVLKDKQGAILEEAHGVFQTIWKKQTDGSWKFVWD